MHFHLKTHPTREKEWDKIFGKRDSPIPVRPVPTYILLHQLVWQQDEPHNLLHLGRAHNAIRLHGKPTKTVKTYQISLFLGGNPQVYPQAKTTMWPKCTWPWVATQHKPSYPIPPRCFIKVVNFQSLRNYPQPKWKGSKFDVAKYG